MKRVAVLFGILSVVVIAGLAHAASEADAVLGKWTNKAKDRVAEIYKCEANKYCGRLVAETKPALDAQNPDPAKRSTPLHGMTFLAGFVYEGKNFYGSGTIYNPDDGKTYKSNMKLDSQDVLKLRGYIGISLLGKTATWTRVKQ